MKTDPGENNNRPRNSSPLDIPGSKLSSPMRRRALPVVAAAAILAVSAAISGCGEGSSANDAITQAAAELRSLAASPPQNPEARDRDFGQIATKLGSVSADGAAGIAAAGLLYEVQLAQGRARAELVGARSAEINAAGRRLREDAMFFELAASRAAALRGVDPSPQRRDLQNQKSDLGSTIEDLRAERVQTVGALAMLQSERDQAAERASNFRAQSRALRERARGVVGLQAAAIAEQAAATDRAADEAEGAAAEFEALAAALMPITSEIELQVRGADRRVEMAEAAGVSLDRWAATATELSNEAQSLADTRERDLNQSVEALSQAVTAFEEISARAEQAFTQAGSAAARSGRDAASRSTAKLSEATAKQALASTLADRAAAFASAAEAIAYAAARTPAPSNAQSLRRSADELRAKAIESSTNANAALEEAATLYESVGGSDERLARLASRLRAESSGNPMATGMMGSAGASLSGKPAEIYSDMELLFAEVGQGNLTAALDYLHFTGDPQQNLLNAIRPLVDAMAELERACTQHLGQGMLYFVSTFSQTNRGGVPEHADLNEHLSYLLEELAASEFVENADGTVMAMGNDPDLSDNITTFARIDGRWKMQFELPPEINQALPMLQGAFGPLAELVRVTARDVQSGELTSHLEVAERIAANPMVAQIMSVAGMPSMGSGG